MSCIATVNVASSAGIHIGDTVLVNGDMPPHVLSGGVVVSVGAGQVAVSTDPAGKQVGETASGGMLSDESNTYVYSLCYDFHLGVNVNAGAGCSLGSSTSGDNGNVFQILNSHDTTRSAMFAYDPLNRLAQANTINTTSANCWGEVYTIDAWGNLTNRAGLSSMPTCMTEPLNAAPATAQNHLPGLLYDTAGNVLNDGIGNTPTHDAENRIATDAGVTYSYDADGTRIEKSSGRMYWTGAGGEYLAESDLSGTVNEEYIYFNGARIARVDRPSGTVHYYFSDSLGSASVITDANGNIEEQYYYYPYGGLVSSVGGYPNHYKFTGKERDAESLLDNFGARYNASSMGRFMSPDWAAKPTTVPYANFGDPQSLNLYSYVRNNPTSLYDPTGHCWSWQPLCGLGQRINNLFHGEGFHTDQQVEDISHRDALFLHQHGVNTEGLSFGALVKTYQTYTKPNSQLGKTYSGRTSGTGTAEENVALRDRDHHMNEQGYEPAQLDKSSTNANAIRGREQQLIEENGGAESGGGTSGNSINGISQTNPNRGAYMDAAEEEFGGGVSGDHSLEPLGYDSPMRGCGAFGDGICE
jgi:RHS repeat-associated protein